MAFNSIPPTAKRMAQIAYDASGDPLGPRILENTISKIVADEERKAYLIRVSATARCNSFQGHYMLYYMERFWHLRTRGPWPWVREVCFYKFPKGYEKYRADIQSCFADAINAYGKILFPGERDTFVPIFTEDDYEPPDI